MKRAIAAFSAPTLLIFTVLIGIYVGAPIAAEHYDLKLLAEVKELFVLLPLGYFYITLPAAVLFAIGFWFVLKRCSALWSALYCVSGFVLFPVVFYGLAVSNYYGQGT